MSTQQGPRKVLVSASTLGGGENVSMLKVVPAWIISGVIHVVLLSLFLLVTVEGQASEAWPSTVTSRKRLRSTTWITPLMIQAGTTLSMLTFSPPPRVEAETSTLRGPCCVDMMPFPDR